MSGLLDLNNDWYGYYQLLHKTLEPFGTKDIWIIADCHSFPEILIAYKQKKVEKNGIYKLRWKILNISDKNKISVLESALHK